MDLTKITAEFDQNLRGTRRHRFLRMQKQPDGTRRFRFFRRRETDGAALKTEFLRFIERFPIARAMERARSFEVRDERADCERVIDGIATAIRGANGYSFVRMGDGEGRFVGPAREYPHLFGQSKLIAKDVWYKYSDAPQDSLYDELASSYRNASVVGYIPASRVEAEANNLWYGYMGSVSGNEFIASCGGLPSRLVRYWTNMDLVRDAALSDLLASKRVCIVGCHASLGPFAAKFPQSKLEQIVIAPEAHPLLANHSGRAKFYPDHFMQIMGGFEKSDAQVYLIGAGIFAKLFCERLRALGKIGLDLGSELDRIAGVKTRSIL